MNIDMTAKQLEKTLRTIIKDETKHLATQQSLEDGLSAVNDGFQNMENRFQEIQAATNRIEKIVDNWPPPNQIKELMSRVNIIEKKLKIKRQRPA